MGADIRKQILELEALPSPPALAVELLDLTYEENVKISQLVALIERDPALTAKMLRHCNSAAYGLPHRVASIERATVMLGIRQVKCLALGILVLTNSEMKQADYFDREHFWKRTSVTAVGARALAQMSIKLLAGEAFASGLLHDIGVLLLQHVAPDEYLAVVKTCAAGDKHLHKVEESLLGISHMQAGETLLRSWGLPETIYAPVGFHHCPQMYDGGETIGQLVEIVAAAGEIANLFCEPNKGGSLERVMRVCAGYFHLLKDQVHDLLKQVGDDARQTAWMFEVRSPSTLDYDHIRRHAEQELEALTKAS